jgi:hypothetical protein
MVVPLDVFTVWRERAGPLGRPIVMAKPYLRFLLAAASAAAAGLLAACGSPHAQTPSPGSPSSGEPTVSPAPTTGLVPAPRGLTDRLVLQQTHVTAGTPIRGTLVVTYRGHAPINLNRGCRPRYAVVVTNHRYQPETAFPSDCGTAPFIIKPGVNRFAITVVTTYGSCSAAANQAASRSPACRHGRERMPPLPQGRYQAVLVGDGSLPLPAPVPVPVSLQRPRSGV